MFQVLLMSEEITHSSDKLKKCQPAGKGSPSSPGSWVWRGLGRTSQKSQSWCSHSWGFPQPSCMYILLDTFYEKGRGVSLLQWLSQPSKHIQLKNIIVKIYKSHFLNPYPASELFPHIRASKLPSTKYWLSVTKHEKTESNLLHRGQHELKTGHNICKHTWVFDIFNEIEGTI